MSFLDRMVRLGGAPHMRPSPMFFSVVVLTGLVRRYQWSHIFSLHANKISRCSGALSLMSGGSVGQPTVFGDVLSVHAKS